MHHGVNNFNKLVLFTKNEKPIRVKSFDGTISLYLYGLGVLPMTIHLGEASNYMNDKSSAMLNANNDHYFTRIICRKVTSIHVRKRL